MSRLLDDLECSVARRPDAPALVHPQPSGKATIVTYRELALESRRFARLFFKLAGDDPVIPLFLAKTARCVAAMFGCLGAGRKFACLNRKLRAPQLEHVAADTGSRIIVTDGPGVMAVRELPADCERLRRIHWLVLRDDTFARAQERAVEQLARVAQVTIVNSGAEADQARMADGPVAPGCCLFTSGSTGAPKGVLIAEDDLVWRADAEVEWYGLTEADVLLSILPFSFDVGLNQLLSGLRAGCRVVLFDSWLPPDIMNAVAAFGVTGISGVPAIWRDFINAGLSFDTAGAHASLRYITVSGGNLSPRHLAALPGVAPRVGIFKTYGQTEAFRATSLRPEEFAARPTSVGRPFAGVRVYVVGADGRRCGPNERGEVVHSGNGIMIGYLDGDGTDEKRRPNPFRGDDDPSESVVHTGDYGWLDEEGFLHLEGRRDAMMKVAGNRVYPDEIANEASAVDGVREIEIIGLLAPSGDTRLVAFVVASPDGPSEAIALKRELTKRLPTYMVPETIIMTSAIPRLPNGKPDRVALRDLAEEC